MSDSKRIRHFLGVFIKTEYITSLQLQIIKSIIAAIFEKKLQLKVEDPLQLEKLNGVVLVIVHVQLLILEIEGKAMALHNNNMNGN